MDFEQNTTQYFVNFSFRGIFEEIFVQGGGVKRLNSMYAKGGIWNRTNPYKVGREVKIDEIFHTYYLNAPYIGTIYKNALPYELII